VLKHKAGKNLSYHHANQGDVDSIIDRFDPEKQDREYEIEQHFNANRPAAWYRGVYPVGI